MSTKPAKRGAAPRTPNAVLYSLAVFFCGLYMRLVFRLRVDRSDPALRSLRGPVLMLGNHASNLDFITMALAAYPRRLNFMVTTYFFRHALLGRLLRFMGCIPKRQYVPDSGAIRACLAAAKRGCSIGIFPEGQVTYTGAAGEIDKSIAKLAKKLGMTVAVCLTHGNHLSCPKWGRGKTYRGAMRATASVVLTPEQLAALSVDEIYAKLCAALDYNEYEWARQNAVKYRPDRITDGLQSILYRCPACKTDFSISSKSNRLFCEKCGYTVEIDNSGLLHAPRGETVFDNPVAWYRWEYQAAEREADAGGFPFTSPCRLYKTIDGRFGYTLCGAGKMTADWRGLHFEGEKEGAPFAFSALVEHQSALTHNMGICGVDVLVGEHENYGLSPDDPRKMIKYVAFYQIAHRRCEAAQRRG